MQLGALLLQIPLLALVTLGANEKTNKAYDELFAEGLSQYYEKDYSGTALKMRLAVDDYLNLVKARGNCVKTCEQEPIRVPEDYATNEELHFLHGILQRGWCVEHCKRNLLKRSSILPISGDLEQQMERRDAYNYIQFSLFQEGDVHSAASAAAVYHYYHPDDDLATKNLALYTEHAEVTEGDFDVQDNIEYVDFWKKGVAAYHRKDYEEMVKYMEMSLQALLLEIDRCRSLCKGIMKNTKNYFFSEAMSQHVIDALKCQYNCPQSLGEFRDDFEESSDFLALYFHYLAYGYLQIGKMPEAALAATTHKRLAPHSDIARMNSAYIKRQVGVSAKDFKEREDIKRLLDMLDKEHALIEIVNKVSGNLMEGVLAVSENTDEMLLEEDYNTFPIGSIDHFDEDSTNLPYVIVETPKDHGGLERLVVDGVLSQEQCQMLGDLAKFGTEGDGYQKKTPHTQFETFEGITVIDAAKKAVTMQVDPELVKLYLNASAMVKDVVAREFNLLKPLYFSYTHLVCRTAREDMVQERSDLSHPVHSDNCVLNEETGECLKVPPAYTWRDYSAILYLNGGFEGGKFFFAHSPKDLSPEVYVVPKCGRMVGFSAGQENMHGVTAVTRGRRCAVALWFTQDPSYEETSYLEAQAMLKQANVA